MSSEVCPVCGGRGFLPSDFYQSNSTDAATVTCRSCKGNGYIYPKLQHNVTLRYKVEIHDGEIILIPK